LLLSLTATDPASRKNLVDYEFPFGTGGAIPDVPISNPTLTGNFCLQADLKLSGDA
jgi:hypothetical protein